MPAYCTLPHEIYPRDTGADIGQRLVVIGARPPSEVIRGNSLTQKRYRVTHPDVILSYIHHELIHADAPNLWISLSFDHNLWQTSHSAEITIRVTTGDRHNTRGRTRLPE